MKGESGKTENKQLCNYSCIFSLCACVVLGEGTVGTSLLVIPKLT